MEYKTITGKVHDLSTWPQEHRQFIRRAYWWYQTDTAYEDFVKRILGSGSPVLDRKENGPEPTKTPFYEVAVDLQARLGVKQGKMTKDWDGPLEPDMPDDLLKGTEASNGHREG